MTSLILYKQMQCQDRVRIIFISMAHEGNIQASDIARSTIRKELDVAALHQWREDCESLIGSSIQTILNRRWR